MKQNLESSIKKEGKVIIKQETVSTVKYNSELEQILDRQILRTYNIMMHQIEIELPHHIPQGWHHKLVRKFKESKFNIDYNVLHELFLSKENFYEKTLEILRYVFGEGNRDQGLEFAIKKEKGIYSLEIESRVKNAKEIYSLIQSKFNRLYIPPRIQDPLQIPKPAFIIRELPKYELV